MVSGRAQFKTLVSDKWNGGVTTCPADPAISVLSGDYAVLKTTANDRQSMTSYSRLVVDYLACF